MSTTSSYVIYKCDVCDRETELSLDGRRPDPVRCNITKNCRGKLQRVGARSAKKFLFTPVVSGLPDFVPRGTVAVPAPELSIPTPITVFTSSGSGIIALAAVKKNPSQNFYITDVNDASFMIEAGSGFDLPSTSRIVLKLFEIAPALLTTKKYTYVFNGPVELVSGADDSPEGKNLRFSSTNQLKVYANGIEKLFDDNPSLSEFDRSVDNQITFTPAIFDTNNVIEIFVYQDITTAIEEDSLINLEFESLRPTVTDELALRELNCWGDYGSMLINSVERFMLYCTDLTVLDQDKSYGVARAEVYSLTETRFVKPSEIFILLGREPFSFRDKELYAFLSGENLITEQAVLAYRQSAASGILQLTVDETVITQTFNPVQPTNVTQATELAASTAGTALQGTEELAPKYILGPR